MGHRALVAYHQADDTFTLRYAHWGVDLGREITPATPLGGPVERPHARSITDPLDVDRTNGYDSPVTTRVDPRPLASGVDAGVIVDAVDPTIESLVVVTPACETVTYLVCSLDPAGGGSGLVLARPDDDPDSLRAWFVEAKSRLSAAVAGGALTREQARATLRRALASHATLYSPDDASFLRER